MSSSQSTSSNASFWLLLWMANNIGVTLLNKAAFATVDFHYPYFLSAIHGLCNFAGSQLVFLLLAVRHSSVPEQDGSLSSNNGWIASLLGNIQRKQLDASGRRLIVAFSVIFSLNIAIGNVSLKHVSVNFNQVMRSMVPVVTIAVGLLLGKAFSARRKWAVVPITVGVAMACFGDMSFTGTGLFYTVACVLLAAVKVVASGEILTGDLKMHPVDLLGHMAPLAMLQCMTMAIVTGEVAEIMHRWETELSPFVSYLPITVVWCSGALSFTMNISSLMANKLTSPLTLCIAANVKQVLMIAVSTVIFHTAVSPLNGSGILVVLAGSAWYSYVCLLEKTKAASKEQAQDLPEKDVELQASLTDDTTETETEWESDSESDSETMQLMPLSSSEASLASNQDAIAQRV